MSFTSVTEPQPSLAWQFENSNVDSVTNLQPSSQVSPGPAQLQGSATLVTTVAGVSNTAVSFPGTSGSYMNLGTGSPSSFSLVTSNIFVEAWIYLTSIPTQNVGIMARSDPLVPANSDFRLLIDSTGAPLFFIRNLNSSITVGSPLTLNQWYHVAGSWSLIPSSNTVAVFTNGTLNQSKTELTATAYASTRETHIGYYNGGYFPGYIRDLRVVQGGVVPVATFTPLASAPFSYASPTYVANMGTTVFTLLGQFVTYSPGKYGQGISSYNNPSIYNSPCYITYNLSPVITETTGFTLSCWVNMSQLPAAGSRMTFVNLSNGTGYGQGAWLSYDRYGSGTFAIYYENTGVSFTASNYNLVASVGTWYHICGKIERGTATIYVNGVAGTPQSYTTTGISYNKLYVLCHNQGVNVPEGLIGTLDDLRIYNTALTAAQVQSVYSSQGAPAPGPVMPQPQYAWDFNGTTTPYIGSATASVTGSVSYSAGKYIQAVNITNSPTGTPNTGTNYITWTNYGTFNPSVGVTACFWINLNALPASGQQSIPLWMRGSAVNSAVFITLTPTYWGAAYTDGTNYYVPTSSTPLSTGVWYHLTVVVGAGTVVGYQNGVQIASPVAFSNPLDVSGFLYLGGNGNYAPTSAIYDDLRIYNTALTSVQVNDIYNQQGVPGRGVQNANGLTFYAPFNGSTTDSIGSITASNAFGIQNSNVILNSNAIYDTGLFSQSINVYNTSSTYYGNVLAYQLTTSTPPPYTISFWFKLNTILGIANEQVVIFRTVNNSFFFKIFINSLTQLTAQIGVYDGSGNVQYPVGFGGGSSLNLNGWNFYCLVVQPNQAVTYVANTSSTIIQTSTASPSSGYTFNNLDTIFGTMYNNGVSNTNRPFCGNIDELRIFKYNLTSAAVQALYSSTTPSTFNPPSILMSGAPLFNQLSPSATSSAVGAFSLRAVNGVSTRAVQVGARASLPSFTTSATSIGSNTYSQSLTGYSFGGSGTHVTKSSSIYNTGNTQPWKAFDNVPSTWWETTGGLYNTLANGGGYTGPQTITIDGIPTSCEWITIQIPTGVVLLSYSMYARSGFTYRMPKNFKIAGSNDGATWTTVDTQTNQTTWTGQTPITFTVTSSTVYTYFALCVTAITGVSSTQNLNVGQWTLNASWQTDFYADERGNLLTAPVVGTTLQNWLGGATGYVTTWYDQSGAGQHMAQTTASLQPVISLATSPPSILFTGNGTTSGQYFQNTIPFTFNFGTNYQYTIRAVVNNTVGGVLVYKGKQGAPWNGTGEKAWYLGPSSYTSTSGNYPDLVGFAEGWVITSTPITSSKTSVTWASSSFSSVAVYENASSVTPTYNRASQISDASNYLYFGITTASGVPYYNGNIYEIEIFSTPLSASDVTIMG